jgi:hypothetical protein
LQVLVLEDDQIWLFSYGTLVIPGIPFPVSFSQGQGVSNNGSFSAPDIKFFFSSPASTLSLSASYVQGATFSGAFSAGSATGTPFAATGIPASIFNYSQPPSVSTITGSWSVSIPRATAGNTVTLTPGSLFILQAGTFSGSSEGCSYSGTLAPRPSGKNVFNFSVTFGPAPCALPGQSATGIALTYLIGGGPSRQLIMAAVDAGRNNATAFFGTR